MRCVEGQQPHSQGCVTALIIVGFNLHDILEKPPLTSNDLLSL